MNIDPGAQTDAVVHFVDTNGNEIAEPGSRLDRTKWRSLYVEDNEDGSVSMVCEPVPSSETAQEKIAELKQKLSETDYVVTKLSEAQLTGGVVSISEEDRTRYEQILAQRVAWRAEINELEGSE